KRSSIFRGAVLGALSRLDDDKVAPTVLGLYGKLPADLQPKAVELLTQRASWGKALLKAVADKKVPASAININQARRMLGGKDADLVKLVKKHWGTVRDGRNPEREKVVNRMRALLQKTRGDAKKGVEVYKKLCAQCHKIHGEGHEVGPDI